MTTYFMLAISAMYLFDYVDTTIFLISYLSVLYILIWSMDNLLIILKFINDKSLLVLNFSILVLV